MQNSRLSSLVSSLALAAGILCATPASAGIVTIDFGSLPTTGTVQTGSPFGTDNSYTEDGITVTKLSGSGCGRPNRSTNGINAAVGITCDNREPQVFVGSFKITGGTDLLTLNSLDLFANNGSISYQFQGFLNGISLWDTGLTTLTATRSFTPTSGFNPAAVDTIFMTFDPRGAISANFDNINLTTTPNTSTVPEPSSLALAGLALAGLAVARKRKTA
jgi:hypothetical protein